MLRVTQLRGFNSGTPSTVITVSRSVTFSTWVVSTTTVPAGTPTYTFSAVPVGSPTTGRLVVVSAFAQDISSFASATINSSAATIIVQNLLGSGTGAGSAFFQMPLPTTETAVDIGITLSPISTFDIQGAELAVFILDGLTTQTPSTFGSSTVNVSSVKSILQTVPLNGIGIGASYIVPKAPATWTAPLTKVFESTNFKTHAIGAAVLTASTAATTVDFTFTCTSSQGTELAAVWF